ncbi:MAG: 4'-phosphopantetheinyl transferase, partial [Gammaproteobacteria bacterium]
MRQNSVVATRSLVWEEMPVRPDLVSGEVHLLSAFTAEDRIPREADWALLTEPEKRRARRFKFDYHRNRWVAGRCGLKRILGIYVGCSSAEIRLRYGDIGKPYLDNRGSKSLMFNYTDSGGYLIYAIGLEQELGIDLEHLPRATNYAGLARKKLSEREKCA